jgi:hypothetical protein
VDSSIASSWISAFVLAYVVGPISLVWGWIQWVRQPKLRTVSAVVSLIAFVIASLSAAVGLGTIGYALHGGFKQEYDFFYRVVALGGAISLAGILVALGGIWRKNSLRWFALAGSVGTLAFWIVATTWP